MMLSLITLAQIVQFELFCVACTCFYYGFVLGYTYIIWRKSNDISTVFGNDCCCSVRV